MRECTICYRPIKWNFALYCSSCAVKLKKDGYAHYRIRLGEVGSDTVNYQQHLHRKFFGCNAPVEYRGIKENRVYNSLEPQSIQLLTKILKKELDSNLTTNLKWLYYNLNKSVSNFTERLLYNSTLYFIHYHITNANKYQSEEHFKSSMIRTLLNHIVKTFVRVNKKEYSNTNTLQLKLKKAKSEITHISFKSLNTIYKTLCEVCGEVVSTLKL